MEGDTPMAPPEQPRSRGRVVILDPEREPRVEILPLPESATLARVSATLAHRGG